MSFTRRFFIILGVSFFTVIPLSAHTVSFIVVETGLQKDLPAVQSSNLWESGLLDVFFDSGHIVSNSPIMRLPAKPAKRLPDEAGSSFNEAKSGGADYFVLALLDYQGAGDMSHPKPKQISLRVFKVNPYRFIAEEQFSSKGNNPVTEELNAAKEAAKTIIQHIK
jgi:hypothetical protein